MLLAAMSPRLLERRFASPAIAAPRPHATGCSTSTMGCAAAVTSDASFLASSAPTDFSAGRTHENESRFSGMSLATMTAALFAPATIAPNSSLPSATPGELDHDRRDDRYDRSLADAEQDARRPPRPPRPGRTRHPRSTSAMMTNVRP